MSWLVTALDTQPLPGGLAALSFRVYLQRHGLSILDVGLVARVRLLVVWRVARGLPIRATQASLVRAALFRLTGTPFRARIAVYAGEAEKHDRLADVL
ncbi:MAG: hypothetical protein ACRDHW_06515 [Ktedonobacteraceae bacterium]